ncbi:MAG: hypothetical protein K9L19_18240 [Desulfarculaceae bacterium]|nr:hypothetical protein [Desulfarculaceae bacterium]
MANWEDQYAIWLRDKGSIINQLILLLPNNHSSDCFTSLQNAIDGFFTSQLADALMLNNKELRKVIKQLATASGKMSQILKDNMILINFVLSEEIDNADTDKLRSDLTPTLTKLRQLCLTISSLANFAYNDWPTRKPGRPEHEARNKFITDLTHIFEQAGGIPHLNINSERTEYSGPYFDFINLACRLVGDDLMSGQSLEKILSRHIKQP